MAVRIRFAGPGDAEALHGIYAPYVTDTAVTFETEPPGTEEFRRRIEAVRRRYPYLAAEEDGRLLGYAYASAFKGRAAYDWTVETSIYIRQGLHRRGLGGRLYAVLEELLRKQGILTMAALVAAGDGDDSRLTRDSILFHEAMGFRTAGVLREAGSKFGRWYHMYLMEKTIAPHEPDPKPILPVSALGFGADAVF